MRDAACLLVAFACSGAFASEPGQPLDCSDWVFLKPGFSCTTVIPRGCGGPPLYPLRAACGVGNPSAVDNDSHVLMLEFDQNFYACGTQGINAMKLDLVRYVGSVREVIGSLAGRCVSPTRTDDLNGLGEIGFFPYLINFDAAGGRVLIPIATFCNTTDNSCPTDYDGDGNLDAPGDTGTSSRQVMAISGFTTTLEVLQTFTPQASLGSRVPYMPEGMAGADHFDTYWGDLAHPLDFTQAHGLQCGYPAAAPHVGDYLTVADTVPTPAPGQGVYYVTSATYQGATRYGRKTTAGHTVGRDPALLPACTP